MKIFILLATSVILSASCASDTEDKDAPSPHKTFSERMNEGNGYKKDTKGNWKPISNKRSSFENQNEPNIGQRNYKKQEYKAGDYAKKSWWGDKEYKRQTYAGNTDGSRFQKSSNLQGKGARETSTTFDSPDAYATHSYTTGAAREAKAAAIQKTTNDKIENRRKVFSQPEIIGWRQQRAISMEQSKGLLGH